MPVTSHYLEAKQVDTIKKQIALPENALILYDFLDKNTLTELHTTAAGLNYTEHNIPNMRHLLSAVAVQKTQQAWRADLEEFCATIGRRIHSDQFCKFSAGNYTLIEKVKTHTITLFIDLTPQWNESWGGSVHHAGTDGSTIVPLRYGAAAAISSTTLAPFVKYVNHHAGTNSRIFLVVTLT